MKKSRSVKSINSCAEDMLSKINDCLNESFKKQDRISSAVVTKVNSDNTVNVCFPPDNDHVFSYISNQSPFVLNVGDSVELLLKNGSYNNCWVIAKHGKNNTRFFDTVQQIETTSINSDINLENLPYIRYDVDQSLDEAQKKRAQFNIGLTGETSQTVIKGAKINGVSLDIDLLDNYIIIPTASSNKQGVVQLTNEYSDANNTSTAITPNFLNTKLTDFKNELDFIKKIDSTEAGKVPKISNDGQLQSSGYTLESSVPANALFLKTLEINEENNETYLKISI